MHGSRSVGRDPPGESAQEAPEGSRGAQCLPCSTAPGSSFLWPQTVGAARPTELPSLRGKPQQEPLKRAAGERGSRRLGSAAAPPTPGRPRMLREEGPPPASNPRAPDSRSFARARARPRAAEGEGRLRARPLLRRPKLPSTPATKLRSHLAAPRAPPRAEPEQLRALAPEKDNRRPLPRRRRLGRGASTAVSTEPKHLAAAAPAPRPPCTQPCPPAHALPADWE